LLAKVHPSADASVMLPSSRLAVFVGYGFNRKLHISDRSVRGFRNLNKPAPKAEGPCSGTIAADVEVVAIITARIRITSGGNVRLLFIVSLLFKC
jgi:hypothetical protein